MITPGSYVGEWTAVESINANLEAYAESEAQTLRIRIENRGSIVRLRGQMKAKAEIKSTEMLFKIPTGFHPPKPVDLLFAVAGTPKVLEVLANGEVKIFANITGTSSCVFDDITYNLT